MFAPDRRGRGAVSGAKERWGACKVLSVSDCLFSILTQGTPSGLQQRLVVMSGPVQCVMVEVSPCMGLGRFGVEVEVFARDSPDVFGMVDFQLRLELSRDLSDSDFVTKHPKGFPDAGVDVACAYLHPVSRGAGIEGLEDLKSNPGVFFEITLLDMRGMMKEFGFDRPGFDGFPVRNPDKDSAHREAGSTVIDAEDGFVGRRFQTWVVPLDETIQYKRVDGDHAQPVLLLFEIADGIPLFRNGSVGSPLECEAGIVRRITDGNEQSCSLGIVKGALNGRELGGWIDNGFRHVETWVSVKGTGAC